MAAKPALEPTLAQEEGQEENDEGEDSDVYDVEGDEEDVYEQDEDEDEEGDEGEPPENMTALLLGKQNGARTEEEEEEEDDEDDEYHEDKEGTVENIPVVAGSKRGVEELSEGDESGGGNDEEAEVEGKNAKKARV